MSGEEMKWITCPVCHGKTRLKLRKDTVIHHFQLYCPKCRKENLINVKDFQVEVIDGKRARRLDEEPDAETQSR